MNRTRKLERLQQMINTLDGYQDNQYFFDHGEYYWEQMKIYPECLPNNVIDKKLLELEDLIISLSKPLVCNLWECPYIAVKQGVTFCNRDIKQECPNTTLPGNKKVLQHKRRHYYLEVAKK